MIGQSKARTVEVEVTSFGEPRVYKLRELSALEIDAIQRAFPRPVPPKAAEGAELTDEQNAEFFARHAAWWSMYQAITVCAMIGPEEFGTDNPAEQFKLLMADHNQAEYLHLHSMASQLNAGELTPEKMEAARAKLVPFVNATSPAPTSQTESA